MQYDDLLKILAAQQRTMALLQKQILHIASVTGQGESKEINESFDLVLTEMNNVHRVMYREDK